MDVTIIVPCRKEKNTITRCINSIVNQKGIGEVFSCEIIIACAVDDDETIEVVKRLCFKNNIIKIIYNSKNTTAAGINLGIKASKGFYIAIIGAHSIVNNDYIMQCMKVIKDTGAENVGGPWRAYGESKNEMILAKIFNSPIVFGYSKSHDINYEGYIDSVWGGFYKRDVFDKIGLFNESLIRNSDDEFNARLIKYGGKIYQSKKIEYKYKVRSSIKKLYLQYYQYGYYRVFTSIVNNNAIKMRQLLPIAFLNILLVLFLALMLMKRFILIIQILFLCLLSLIILAIKVDKKQFLKTGIMIIILYLGYAIGQDVALFDFLFRKKRKQFDVSR